MLAWKLFFNRLVSELAIAMFLSVALLSIHEMDVNFGSGRVATPLLYPVTGL